MKTKIAGTFFVVCAIGCERAPVPQVIVHREKVIEYREAPSKPLSEVDRIINEEALKNGINPAIIRAQMKIESRGKHDAKSPKGARGLMQIMPANAKRCGLTPEELWDKRKNIACGTQVIAEELRVYGGDAIKALKVYNGGPRALKGNFKESENYVVIVLREVALDLG